MTSHKGEEVPFVFKGLSYNKDLIYAHVITHHVENQQVKQNKIRIYHYNSELNAYQLAICELVSPILTQFVQVEVSDIQRFCSSLYRSGSTSDRWTVLNQ